jgi:hypothetical protein
MLKKLAVPFLTLALAFGFGCSSSSSNNGTGGSGGAGGKGGGAGTAAGGKGGGAAGSSAAGTTGSGGAAGSSVAGTNGGGGKAGGGGSAAAGSGGGAAGSNGGAGGVADAGPPDGSARAECTVTDMSGTDVLTPAVFCSQLEVNCPNQFAMVGGSRAACESTYSSSGMEHCRSYHMCWGVLGITMEGGVGMPAVHCPHTIGMNLCKAVTDAATGN